MRGGERGGEKEHGEGIAAASEGEGEEPGSHDQVQKSHDGSHDQPPKSTAQDQNLSQGSHDQSRGDASPDFSQSGQPVEEVDLQDTHDEL